MLEAIAARAAELMPGTPSCSPSEVRPALADEGITSSRWDTLADAEKQRLHEIFRERVFPVLTPLAVDPAHPFPYISGPVAQPRRGRAQPARPSTEHFARVKVPPLLPRFVEVEPDAADPQLAASAPTRCAPRASSALEDLIAVHLDQLFPGMEVLEHHTFRVTRNEDLEVEEDDAENLLQALEKELLRRRFGPPVRLELAEDIGHARARPARARARRRASPRSTRCPSRSTCAGCNAVADVDRGDLHYPKFVPKTHRAPRGGRETAKPSDIFAAIRQRDVLLHHPYDSFSTSVQAFLEQAAADPHVLAIKQTLYRTRGDSPIVDALIDAAEAGKQVLALVEIKARFDEQANISWARKLEQAGVHVVYGIVGPEDARKLSLVVRQEADGLRRYCHIGTGNYNPKTARLYKDLGLLTCDPQVGEDLTRLFNQLSGYAPKTAYRRLLVAPRSLRAGSRADRAGGRPPRGRTPAWVRIKVELDGRRGHDRRAVPRLAGGRAGGPRGPWHLRAAPGRAGPVGEHPGALDARPLPGALADLRVRGGGEPDVYIGSADMMHRNLDRRVEALVRIADPGQIAELDELLDLSMDPGRRPGTSARTASGPATTWTPTGAPAATCRRTSSSSVSRRTSRRGERDAVSRSGTTAEVAGGAGRRPVVAAGAVVWRVRKASSRSLLVHRPALRGLVVAQGQARGRRVAAPSPPCGRCRGDGDQVVLGRPLPRRTT